MTDVFTYQLERMARDRKNYTDEERIKFAMELAERKGTRKPQPTETKSGIPKKYKRPDTYNDKGLPRV